MEVSVFCLWVFTRSIYNWFNPFPAIHHNLRLLSLHLMYFGAYIANNMGQDQTFPLGAKKLKKYVKLASMHYCLQ